ncbi:MAG TPA: tetratricopeptide repeat protein [Rhizomicrobium sp.]|nr:tetratricopeptide repeat protein [Rhizomicrobium sp.]
MDRKALTDQAIALQRSGRLDEAERLYLEVLAQDPRDFTARHLLGVTRAQSGRTHEALADIEQALEIDPGDPDAMLNRANVLKMLNRPQDALAGYDEALKRRPGWAQAQNNRGTVLQALGRHKEALAAYDQVLAVQPGHLEALNNRGSVLQDLRRPAEALAAYEQALRLAPNFATAFNNRGSALMELKRFGDALSCFDRALALRPGDTQAMNNRGNALQGLLRYDEALAAYDQALALKPDYGEAQNNRGQALQQLKRHDEALAAFDGATPAQPQAFGGAAMAALDLCDWTRTAQIELQMERRIAAGEAISPWVLLGYSGNEQLQRQCAANVIRQRFPLLPPPLATGGYRHGKTRIAYISSDIGHHPVTSQVVQLIENHERGAFEIIGIGTNPDDGSPQRRRMVSAFDRFIDGDQLTPFALAEQLRALEVDILVDLNGHTRGDNFDVMSHRPAPVQASWLGYAGTTAAPFIDYVIADPIIAPHAEGFSETLAYLPHCFFPCDTSRSLGTLPSRADAGLPQDAFVFCCFNNAWKITEPVFSIWMRLLTQIPGSVLWLKQAGEKTKANLRQAAADRGVDPDRLVFAKPAPLDVHLVRHQLADLFLDTLPYNAHATACDALWAGLPVLTRRGSAFAGRVAASLLTAIGLPELIVESAEDYEARALALARDPSRLKGLRDKLAANRATAPLFDTPRLARDLETLYRRMLERT